MKEPTEPPVSPITSRFLPFAVFAVLAACAGVVAAVWLVSRPDVRERPEPTEPGQHAGDRHDAERLAQLQALGYVDWAETSPSNADKSGITLAVPGKYWPGVLFYHSRSRSRAQLLSPSGALLHSWSGEQTPGGWHHVEFVEDGDLLVVRRDGVLERLDWTSNVLWRRDLHVHHDLAVTASGSIYVLSHARLDVPFRGRRISLVDDSILELTPGGEVVRSISLYPLFGDAIAQRRLEAIAARSAEDRSQDRPLHGIQDVFHTNTIEVLPRDVPGLGRAGDFLLGLRELDLVAAVSADGDRVLWRWGEGELDRPHQPSVLPGGHVLVFDNGASRGASRVVEVDPVTRDVVWEYAASPREAFFSQKMGGAEGLPGGNVLVTESQRGRAFEVTRTNEIVFEFWNPERRVGTDRRAAIHRLRKLPPESVEPLLSAPGGSP